MARYAQVDVQMITRTFFLGAGFSKALNPNFPTLFELSKAVVANFKVRYPQGAIRLHFDSVPAGFESDIEKLLTYLYSDWPWKSSVEKDLDKALYKAFVYEIADVLENIPMVEISRTLRMFIHAMRSLDQNHVVSLNYDTLIEQYRLPFGHGPGSAGLKGLEIRIEEIVAPTRRTSSSTPWVVDGPNMKSAPDRRKNVMTVAREWLDKVGLDDFCAAIASASLQKEDGVITQGFSWAKIAYESFKRPYDTHYPVERGSSLLGMVDKRKHEGSVGKTMHLHGSLAWIEDEQGPTIRLPSGDLEKLPAIVPPVLDKSQHYAAGRLKAHWIRAHAAIRQSNEIVIIGFSFPPTDISCSYLFSSAAMPGCRIVAINRDPNIRDRYEAVLGVIPGVQIDFSYTGYEDSLERYIKAEILNTWEKL